MSETQTMAGPTTLGLSDDLLQRVDALVHRLQHSDLSEHLQVTRELVLRLALLHGIEQLEQQAQL